MSFNYETGEDEGSMVLKIGKLVAGIFGWWYYNIQLFYNY